MDDELEMRNLAAATRLLQRQDALQAEARQVLADLDLMALLSTAGQPVQVGSLALGLMAWRDIDIHVYCDPFGADVAFETMRPLASHPRVTKLHYANWRGPLAIPTLPDGYYWSIRYRADGDAEWKLDVWFSPTDAPRHEQAYMAALESRLTPQARAAILRIKEVWHRLPTYRKEVVGVDIYDAVLEHGIRTPDEFDVYLAQRGKRGH